MFHAEKRKQRAVAAPNKRSAYEAVPFDEHVRAMRDKIQERRCAIPAMQAEARELVARAAGMRGKRHLWRLANDIERHVAKMQRHVEYLSSNEREVEFDAMVAPYQQAYNRAVGTPATRRLGGSGSCSSLSHVVHSSKTQCAGIMNEYVSEVGAMHPRMSLSQCNSCCLCGKPMVLVSARAVLTCSSCGYATAFLDTTSTNMSYGNEMDFTSFSYKCARAALP